MACFSISLRTTNLSMILVFLSHTKCTKQLLVNNTKEYDICRIKSWQRQQLDHIF